MTQKTKKVMNLGESGLSVKKKKLTKSSIDVDVVEESVSKIHPESEEPTVRVSGKFRKSVYMAMKKKTLERGETVTGYIDRLVRKDLGL